MTGDLVAETIKIAAGEELSFSQDDIAAQVALNAE